MQDLKVSFGVQNFFVFFFFFYFWYARLKSLLWCAELFFLFFLVETLGLQDLKVSLVSNRRLKINFGIFHMKLQFIFNNNSSKYFVSTKKKRKRKLVNLKGIKFLNVSPRIPLVEILMITNQGY